MKRFAIIAVTAALSLPLISGCAGAETSEPEATAESTFVSPIPKVDSDQEARLKTELTKISPLLVNDKTVDNARNQCMSILGGTPETNLVTAAKARFTAREMKAVSDDQAQQIIEVIKTNGFCKPAG